MPTKTLPIFLLASTLTCLLAPSAAAQSPQSTEPAPHSPDSLHQLNSSIETLVHRVSPAVIQILVTGYGTAETTEGGQNTAVIERHRAIGSGVIVDPDGYIVTNAHVVNGAQTIDVIVPPHPQSVPDTDEDDPNAQAKNYQARIIGVARDIDLAVIKIDAHDLPAISLKRAAARARQGELVFAFGSPEGLRNTVTMGVVSAVARQPDPDSPLVYVQTDTPINPGNSGGPLVDADGELVGINTFILSSSGGNQGLGFAIPAGVVVSAYPQLLKYGHVHHPSIGALVQTITPELASGLRLPRDFGVVVSDIVPGGPADSAGMKIQDIILNVDGSPTSTLPLFSLGLNLHKAGDHAKIIVLRGSQHVPLDITLIEKEHKEDSLAEKVDPVKNLIRPLNMLGLELTLDIAKELPDLRIPTGVIVAARTAGTRTSEIPLQTGDVIHGMNGTPVTTLEGLRESLAKLKPGDAIALQIERYSQLFFVSFTR
jgi:serine protease Do